MGLRKGLNSIASLWTLLWGKVHSFDGCFMIVKCELIGTVHFKYAYLEHSGVRISVPRTPGVCLLSDVFE